MTDAMRVTVPIGVALVLAMPGNSVLLRYRFSPHEELRYHLRLSMQTRMEEGGKQPLVAPINTGDGVWVLRVLSVHKDGSAEVSSGVIGLTMRLGGGAVADPETVTFTLSPSGRVTGMHSPYTRVPGRRRTFRDLAAVARISTSLPQGSVHAGSKWISCMPSPVWGVDKVRVQGRVVSISGVPGRRIANLEQRFQFPIRLALPDGAEGAGDTTEWNADGVFTVVSSTRFLVERGIPVATEVEARGTVRVSPLNAPQAAGGAARLYVLVRASTRLQR
ncbi:MAG: hypothetical protein ACP5VE_05035 [Chthonomonadales bacterium]